MFANLDDIIPIFFDIMISLIAKEFRLGIKLTFKSSKEY